ncbi:MAG: Deoxyribonuclease YabD [Thermoanaerobacterales bacterium 50_218]|nr:MAG: Deoxyribonuclease YabD [Thermoanaerobacterales bacterium 50_218]HAA89745.1 hydrolase TatD [Peptococcaceae bacterium]
MEKAKQLSLIDTHAHLTDPEYDEDRFEVIARAQDAGLEKIICVGYEITSSRRAVALAEEYECLYAAIGVHPHDAAQVTERAWDALRILAGMEKVVAIGEIGLDFYRNLSPPQVQEKVFRKQLELACELQLPVIIHDREAHQDVLRILKEFPEAPGVVIHCFSGDLQMAEECLVRGYYISIAGPVTFPKAKKLEDVVKSFPLERLLLETDCPYLAPQPWRGKRNEPGYLPAIAEAVARIKGVSLEEVAATTTENARRFFGLPSV